MRDKLQSVKRRVARAAAIIGGLAFGLLILVAKKIDDLLSDDDTPR